MRVINPVTTCYVYKLLALIPDIVIVAGIVLGWITRWTYYEYPTLILLGIAGILVFAVHLIGSFYMDQPEYTSGLMHFWVGWALGVLSLLDNADLTHFTSLEHVSSLLLVTSFLANCLVEVFMKVCAKQPRVGASKEWWEFTGVFLACLVIGGENAWPLFVMIVAFASVVAATKMRSFLALGLLVYLIVSCEMFMFPKLHISVNPFAVMVLLGRLLLTPVLNLFTISMPRLQRWQWFICQGQCLQKISLALVVVAEVALISDHASAVRNHKEWYVMLPIFCIFSGLWTLMHIVFVVVWSMLLSRFSRCREIAGESLIDAQATPSTLVQLKRILAAKGLRYIGMIAKPLLWGSIISTVIVHALCWTVKDAYQASLFVIVMSVELVTSELLGGLAGSLGGSCIGYGVLAPESFSRFVIFYLRHYISLYMYSFTFFFHGFYRIYSTC